MRIVLILIVIVILFPSFISAQREDDYTLAIMHYKNREFIKAVTKLDKIVNTKPDPKAYYLKGYALYELGRYEEASKHFMHTYFIQPDFKAATIFQTGDIRKKLP